MWQAAPVPIMQLAEMKAPDVKGLNKDVPVIIPVGALEQHGQHLPVFTDSMLLGEIIKRTAEIIKDRALFAPVFWLGNSDHHLDFSGTLSASPRTYLDILGDLLENLIYQGFRRIVIINGHGGNDVPGRQAIFEKRQKYRSRADLLLLFGTYWLLGSKAQELDPSLQQSHMGHACEWETSMILKIAPQLVHDHKNLRTEEFGVGFEPAHRGWVTQDRSILLGHIGSPQLASPEKGERLFQIFTNDVVALIERVIKWNGQSWNG